MQKSWSMPVCVSKVQLHPRSRGSTEGGFPSTQCVFVCVCVESSSAFVSCLYSFQGHKRKNVVQCLCCNSLTVDWIVHSFVCVCVCVSVVLTQDKTGMVGRQTLLPLEHLWWFYSFFLISLVNQILKLPQCAALLQLHCPFPTCCIINNLDWNLKMHLFFYWRINVHNFFF